MLKVTRPNTARCDLSKIQSRQTTRRHIPGQNYIHRWIQEHIKSGGTGHRSVQNVLAYLSVSEDKNHVVVRARVHKLWEENRIMVLRKTLGRKGRKLCNKELHDFCSSPNIASIRWAGHSAWKERREVPTAFRLENVKQRCFWNPSTVQRIILKSIVNK